MTNTETTAWIAERAKCDMDAFQYDVRDMVVDNTAAMNRLCASKTWSCFDFLPLQDPPLQFAIEQHHGGVSRRCTFVYNAAQHVIQVRMEGPDRTYMMQTEWDAEQERCLVVVQRTEGQYDPLKFPRNDLRKAVSAVLEPFFFPPPQREHSR